MNLTPELLSAYVDGELEPELARQVEAQLVNDEDSRAAVEDLTLLGELFGEIEGEPVGSEMLARLTALRPVPTQAAFEMVAATPVRRRSWIDRGMAIAALLLVAVGLGVLLHRPEVVLEDYALQSLDAAGRVVDTKHKGKLVLRAGDPVRTGPAERISYRTADGAVVVLMPDGALEVGDPGERVLFELTMGTVLCTVHDRGEVRHALAGPFRIHADGADCGVRIDGAMVRTAGAGVGREAEITVAVRSGLIEVGENGGRERLAASERVVLRRGAAALRSKAWQDPIYLALMRRAGREIVPGYFDAEGGVVAIPQRSWIRGDLGALVHVISDLAAAEAARYLVLHVEAPRPMRLLVTRLAPYAETVGLAEASTVEVAGPGVVAIPLARFDGPLALKQQRAVPAGRSSLMRIEVRSAEGDVPFALRGSLWAARPQSDTPGSEGPGEQDGNSSEPQGAGAEGTEDIR